MFRADFAQNVCLLLTAHDVDEADAVLDADLVEHLPEVGGCRGVHQRGVASRRMVSTMPKSDVNGLTKQDAPSAAVVPSGSSKTSLARMVRYCAYMAPPIIATVLPISALAASDEPVLITTPAPSLPTGIDLSSRPAIAFIAASGTLAVMTGASLVPDAFAVVISAAPTSKPRSDGLIGEASTRTTTSSGPGSGTGTLASDISSSPLFLISERSCSPVVVSVLIVKLPIFRFNRISAGSVLTLAGKRKPPHLSQCRCFLIASRPLRTPAPLR